MRMNVTTDGRRQRVDTAMQVGDERERKITLGEEGAEVQGDERPEEAVRKFHVGFMKLMRVLRPQRSTLDKYLRGSLSKADRTEPI